MHAGRAKAKILVVDDHALVREGLVHVLEGNAQYTVCAQAAGTGDTLDGAGKPGNIKTKLGLDADLNDE